VIGLVNADFVVMEVDVVAYTAAKSAGGVLDELQRHSCSSLSSVTTEGCYCLSRHWASSGPDDTRVNTQPSARPWKLPRTRRGMKRPGSISVQAASSAGTSAEKCGPSAPLGTF